MKIKKLTAYLLMSGMILGTMSSDLYTIKAQAVETIEETEDKTCLLYTSPSPRDTR